MKKVTMIVVFFAIICSVHCAATADAVVTLFTDATCSTVGISNGVPILARNDVCAVAEVFGSSFKQVTSNGVTAYSFACDSTCNNCQITGTTTVGTCKFLTTINGTAVYFQGLAISSPTTVVATVQSTRSIFGTNFFNQTCTGPTTTTFNLVLGTCSRSFGSFYQLVTEVTGRTGISYSVSRNCTDSNCLFCRNGGWYESISSCYRIDSPSSSSPVDVSFSPFVNVSTTSTSSTSSTSSTGATSTSTASSFSSSSFYIVSVLIVLFAVASFGL